MHLDGASKYVPSLCLQLMVGGTSYSFDGVAHHASVHIAGLMYLNYQPPPASLVPAPRNVLPAPSFNCTAGKKGVCTAASTLLMDRPLYTLSSAAPRRPPSDLPC